MWARLLEWMAALIDRVDLGYLRLIGGGRQRKVGVATRLSQHLHFRINSTESTARRVSQRYVAVNESVLR